MKQEVYINIQNMIIIFMVKKEDIKRKLHLTLMQFLYGTGHL